MFLWLRKLLFKPVIWLSNKYTSAPDRQRVYKELSDLFDCIIKGEHKKGPIIEFDPLKDKFIIFSDQHKGAKNGADDFMLCEVNYLAALDYYYQQGFFFISNGDCEELWENTLLQLKKHKSLRLKKRACSLIPIDLLKYSAIMIFIGQTILSHLFN